MTINPINSSWSVFLEESGRGGRGGAERNCQSRRSARHLWASPRTTQRPTKFLFCCSLPIPLRHCCQVGNTEWILITRVIILLLLLLLLPLLLPLYLLLLLSYQRENGEKECCIEALGFWLEIFLMRRHRSCFLWGSTPCDPWQDYSWSPWWDPGGNVPEIPGVRRRKLEERNKKFP